MHKAAEIPLGTFLCKVWLGVISSSNAPCSPRLTGDSGKGLVFQVKIIRNLISSLVSESICSPVFQGLRKIDCGPLFLARWKVLCSPRYLWASIHWGPYDAASFLPSPSSHLTKGSMSQAQRWRPACCEGNSKRCGVARTRGGRGAAWTSGLAGLGHRGSWPPQNEAGLYPACSGKAGKDFEPGMNMVKDAL